MPVLSNVFINIARNETTITSKRKHDGFFSLDGTIRPRRSGAQNTQNPSPSTIGIKAQPHSRYFCTQETHRSHPKQTPSPVAVQHVKVHPDSDSGKHRPKFIRSKHPNNAIHSSPSLILMPEALPTPWIRRCRAWRVSYSCAVHQHNSQPPLINSTIYKLRYIHTRHKYDRLFVPSRDFIFKYRRVAN